MQITKWTRPIISQWTPHANSSRVTADSESACSCFGMGAEMHGQVPGFRIQEMMGKQKAAVFPDPVCAQAIRSRRARPMGIAYFCTGVGFL